MWEDYRMFIRVCIIFLNLLPCLSTQPLEFPAAFGIIPSLQGFHLRINHCLIDLGSTTTTRVLQHSHPLLAVTLLFSEHVYPTTNHCSRTLSISSISHDSCSLQNLHVYCVPTSPVIMCYTSSQISVGFYTYLLQ